MMMIMKNSDQQWVAPDFPKSINWLDVIQIAKMITKLDLGIAILISGVKCPSWEVLLIFGGMGQHAAAGS